MPQPTRVYTDLDMNFIAGPMTGDITKKRNEQAIKQSIKNLILTQHYEKPFHPEIGSPVYGLLFEPESPLLTHTIERSIHYTLSNFEPRIQIEAIKARSDPNNNQVVVAVRFTIINTQQQHEVDVILQRTR